MTSNDRINNTINRLLGKSYKPDSTLKNARSCVGCWCYEETMKGQGDIKGYCGLGYDVEVLIGNKCDVGRQASGKQYTTYHCRPAEPCSKPLTRSQFIKAIKK